MFTIGKSWLTGLVELVRRDDLRVLLTLNLAVHSPALAVSFASAAERALPRATLAGLEIGNEPDLYWQQPWLNRQRIPSTEHALPRKWTGTYSPLVYRADYEAYARALSAQLGPIPLGAPNTTSPALPWLKAATGLGPFSPEFISVHRYALSTCWPKGSSGYPTIAGLLAERSSTRLARSVRLAARFAHENGMQFRVTELNSVSCGGNAGVADSFATALWAPDALFELIRAGVDGVNVHLRAHSLNAPFQLTAGGIKAFPELYGLVVFAQVARANSRLLNSTLASSPLLHLKAWATRAGSLTTVLLINKGAREAIVTIPAPGADPRAAVLRRLLAPEIGDERFVRYAGRWIGSDGRWHGRELTGAARAIRGVYHVLVPAFSALTVTVTA